MSLAFAEFAEKLVSISDFSQGRAGKIFNDVAENDNEYIVLKNNQPTAVLISVREYKNIQQKAVLLDKILEKMEDVRVYQLAEQRSEAHSIPFEDFVREEGFSMEELEALSESVEFE